MSGEMASSAVEAQLLEFLRRRVFRGMSGELTRMTSLQGVLNSNAMLALLEFIQGELQIPVPFEVFISAKFKDVDAVLQFVEQHRAQP